MQTSLRSNYQVYSNYSYEYPRTTPTSSERGSPASLLGQAHVVTAANAAELNLLPQDNNLTHLGELSQQPTQILVEDGQTYEQIDQTCYNSTPVHLEEPNDQNNVVYYQQQQQHYHLLETTSGEPEQYKTQENLPYLACQPAYPARAYYEAPHNFTGINDHHHQHIHPITLQASTFQESNYFHYDQHVQQTETYQQSLLTTGSEANYDLNQNQLQPQHNCYQQQEYLNLNSKYLLQQEHEQLTSEYVQQNNSHLEPEISATSKDSPIESLQTTGQLSSDEEFSDEDEEDDEDDESTTTSSSIVNQKGSLTRDEKRAREANIPMTYQEIVNLSIDQFNDQLAKFKLSESQLTLIKDIRRRGKNKVAAQSCRKRKMEQINESEFEVNQLINNKHSLNCELNQLMSSYKSLYEQYDKMSTYIQERMEQLGGSGSSCCSSSSSTSSNNSC